MIRQNPSECVRVRVYIKAHLHGFVIFSLFPKKYLIFVELVAEFENLAT